MSPPPAPPQRSALSRQGSLTGMAPLEPPRTRSTFVLKTMVWFTATLLLGLLAAIGLVLALGNPETAPPAARRGAAVAVLPVGEGANATWRLVVWSGLAQNGALLRDSHALR